ncbi:8-hydroxy-5-deazaflavin:NADPH oxidoreductase [Halolamina pelagica]|uniref:8-hydroxy-5-deazaflavin:NADPH oxidoreductase n=1 Tax=Halolamina pelagica TaxID=699431 RepID=A0A0N8HZE9_9EURY|nr:NADPH-dependent F420 reductase [Halolamina pelagica]KPN29315.1 8-hydroxy-5-deazaflavin:NADPH oxidoreductase [Halolamina pelagica]
MDIAILGGTGDIGEGLALRLAYHTNHEVLIGSRDAEKAEAKAAEYEAELDSRGMELTIDGGANADVATLADVVIVAVPPYYVTDTIEAVADDLDAGDILVTPATGMDRDDDGFHYAPPPAGSVTEHAASAVPDGVELVGAFHNLAAGRLANLDADLGVDTFVVGDDGDAKGIVTDIAEGIDGLRALDAGGLGNAAEVESLTPLLINVAANNDGLHDLGLELK